MIFFFSFPEQGCCHDSKNRATINTSLTTGECYWISMVGETEHAFWSMLQFLFPATIKCQVRSMSESLDSYFLQFTAGRGCYSKVEFIRK